MNVPLNEESIRDRLKQISLSQSNTNSNNKISQLTEINQQTNKNENNNKPSSGGGFSFQESLKKELNSNSISKEKFTNFIQQANQMFSNYEKEITILRKKTSFFNSSELHCINNNFSFEPSKKDKVLYQLTKLTEKENKSLNEIKIAYTERICELLTENDALTKMIDKINTNIVDRLQEKINELSNHLKTVEFENSNLKRKLENMDSIIDQNGILKEDITYKTKELKKYKEIKGSLDTKIKELNDEISLLNVTITNNKSTIESKNRIIEQNTLEINTLTKTIEQKNELLQSNEETIKNKDEEITLLYTDNLKWEEKYTLSMKEIDNYKKWSLWDMNLIESFKKIDELQNNITTISQNNEILSNQYHVIQNENSMYINQIKDLNDKLIQTEQENTNLNIIKDLYQQNKNKIDNYEPMMLENNKLKNELQSLNEKYKTDMNNSKETFEKTIENQKTKYENEINEIKIEFEIKINQLEQTKNTQNEIYETQKLTLNEEITKLKKEITELNEQIEKKSLALTNYKEAYDTLMLKLKDQEQQLISIQSSKEASSIFNSENTNNTVNTTTEKSNSTKITSTIDKYAFTKEIIIDYFYCLYLFETSIHYQSLTNNLLGNIDYYLNNIFNNVNRTAYSNFPSTQIEYIQDLYFTSVNKLLNNNKKIKYAYEINFETFDRDTLKDINDELQMKNFIYKITPTKPLDKLITLFLKKYTKNFDFEGTNLIDYFKENILSSIEYRVDRRIKSVNNDTIKLLEMTLSAIKNGQIYINNRSIYSFENYIQQNNNIKLNNGSLTVTNKIVCLDNIIYTFKYEKINELILVNNSLNDNDFSFLIDMIILHLPKIKTLKIISNNFCGDIFTSKFITALKLLKEITYLDISDNKIVDEDIKMLTDFLKTNKTIQTLILDSNKLTSTTGFFIADALNKNHTLQTLSLNHNEITSSGLESLLNVINNNNHSLLHLYLGDNKLQKDEFDQIAMFFNSNPPLKTIDLSNNVISPLCSNIMGVNLKKAKLLKCLKLNNTKMDEESGPQFLNFIHETNIEELELNMNFFGESGPFLIMNKIKSSPNIRKLSLKNCAVTPVFLNIIAQCIIGNKTLEEINLEGNDFDVNVFKQFCMNIKDKTQTKLIFNKGLINGNVNDINYDNILFV